jgi:hypothetical protein
MNCRRWWRSARAANLMATLYSLSLRGRNLASQYDTGIKKDVRGGGPRKWCWKQMRARTEAGRRCRRPRR